MKILFACHLKINKYRKAQIKNKIIFTTQEKIINIRWTLDASQHTYIPSWSWTTHRQRQKKLVQLFLEINVLDYILLDSNNGKKMKLKKLQVFR